MKGGSDTEKSAYSRGERCIGLKQGRKTDSVAEKLGINSERSELRIV